MFARVTTYELQEGRVSESIDAFQPAFDRVSGLDGFVEAMFLVEREGTHAVSVTLWESLEAMERSQVAASMARTQAAHDADAEIASSYEVEVGIRATTHAVGEEAFGLA